MKYNSLTSYLPVISDTYVTANNKRYGTPLISKPDYANRVNKTLYDFPIPSINEDSNTSGVSLL